MPDPTPSYHARLRTALSLPFTASDAECTEAAEARATTSAGLLGAVQHALAVPHGTGDTLGAVMALQREIRLLTKQRDDCREQIGISERHRLATIADDPDDAAPLRAMLAALGAAPPSQIGPTPEISAAASTCPRADLDLVNGALRTAANDAIGQIDRKRGLEAFASSRDARACRVLLRDLRAGAEGSSDGTTEQIDAIMILLGLDA